MSAISKVVWTDIWNLAGHDGKMIFIDTGF